MSVRVAVRVRPFNQREISNNAELCIKMNGPTTTIIDDDGHPKDFAFDYSFWSHDGFKNREDGYSEAEDNKYIDQRAVYNELGKSVLDNAWDGYHCCLFAYGQTGSGKSYSMIGYGANKGIVPMACEEIFQRIQGNTDADKAYEVTVSMVEIYNEKVQDLLINPSKRPQQGLKIREHSTVGVYVEGLSKHPVSSYRAIEAKMDEGSKNRTIGSTQMNATSSRAHTVIAIEFKQIVTFQGKKSEKFSVINLVDLAGSEKADQTGATGDRLKEGCAINKSLTCLGQVISVLADKAMGKGGKLVVPYRDSALTRMLQNALGGNSKTIMICALSPANINYEETMSTLRYADRAKKIQNKAIVNESPQDKLIRELKEENERLKAELAKGGGGGHSGSALMDEEAKQKLQEMEEQMRANQEAMKEMEKSWEQKLQEAKQREEEDAKLKQKAEQVKFRPHIVNLNEDPLLDRKILYDLTQSDQIHIGRKNGNPAPQVVLGGIGIQANHAFFEVGSDGQYYLKPSSASSVDQISVNGKKLTSMDGIMLTPNDRIVFGTHSVFLFKDPDNEASSSQEDSEDNPITWESAQSEKAELEDQNMKKQQEEQAKRQEEETKQKMMELENRMAEEKKKQEEMRIQMQKEYEEKLKQLQQNNEEEEGKKLEQKMKEEMEKMKKQEELRLKQREAEEKKIQRKQQEQSDLEKRLGQILPLVNEANLIAKELKREIIFNAKLIKSIPETREDGTSDLGTTDIVIKTENFEEGYYYQWPEDKFNDRIFMMRDLVNEYFESGTLPKLTHDTDPFWDPPEPMLIGQSFISMKNLGYLIENEMESKILSSEGNSGVRGQLSVKYFPTDEAGQGEPNEDDLPEEPEDLLGKPVTFRVEIEKAKDLPVELSKNTFVNYKFGFEGNKINQTQENNGKERNPVFNFKKVHHIEKVTPSILAYLQNGQLCFRVYGYPDYDQARKMQKKELEESKKEVTQKEDLKRKATVKLENEAKHTGREESKAIHQQHQQQKAKEEVKSTHEPKKEADHNQNTDQQKKEESKVPEKTETKVSEKKDIKTADKVLVDGEVGKTGCCNIY
ncbi:kinesin motor domain containing protein [Stylonychia lemnae]|uniref:Kinesin motor domain containing protein n=1 Tax=Stylonychia lemnae TaxID=5949 RepID=A0A078AEX3_STYLE|nr:kinesin motor domain containing protein [Stylonychia lemnae]|eukprot:CDW79443.1 kinesin motor domain containing protein [Stylonychia lemnae]